MAGGKKFLVHFEDGHNKYISSVSLSYVCSKEKLCIDMDESISELPPK